MSVAERTDALGLCAKTTLVDPCRASRSALQEALQTQSPLCRGSVEALHTLERLCSQPSSSRLALPRVATQIFFARSFSPRGAQLSSLRG